MSKQIGISTSKGFIETDGTVLSLKDVIQEANGVIKVGDIIIPQKKLIFNTPTISSDDELFVDCVFTEELSAGDIIEFEYTIDGRNGCQYKKLKICDSVEELNIVYSDKVERYANATQFYKITFKVEYSKQKLSFSAAALSYLQITMSETEYGTGNVGEAQQVRQWKSKSRPMQINKIYKVIE